MGCCDSWTPPHSLWLCWDAQRQAHQYINGVVSLRKPFRQITPQAAMKGHNTDLPGQSLHGMKRPPQTIPTVCTLGLLGVGK